MKSKKMMVAVLSMGMLALSACGNTEPTEAPTEPPTEQAQTNEARSKKIFSGSYSEDDTFVYQRELYENNGAYVNFWIDNTGDKSVTIIIDRESDKNVKREIKAGENGHISAKIDKKTRIYEFMALPTSDSGGTITFDYRIVQRDKQQ